MKKTISLLLALVMCLSLCACGKNDAVKNVETLIDAIGEVTLDSDAAIAAAEEAYNALTAEDKTAVENYALLQSARESLDRELFRQSILGDWLTIDGSMTFTFYENGECTISGAERGSYEVDRDTIKVTILGLQVQLVVEDDETGIRHMKAEDLGIDCVQEDDFAAFQPEIINIATENWEEYFEIRQVRRAAKNAFGEYTEVTVYNGLFLKEAYLEKLASGEYPSNVSFEIQYDYNYREYVFDTETGNLTISDTIRFPAYGDTCTTIAEARDYRDTDTAAGQEYMENSPMGQYAALVEVVTVRNDEGYYIHDVLVTNCSENMEVLRVTGTLYLYK